MNRELSLKVVLVPLGLFFMLGTYPVTLTLWHRDQSGYGDAMWLSLYIALGVFLLMAVRNPSANRSLIAFTAWSSFAHGGVMAMMAFRDERAHDLLPGVVILAAIGVVLIVLAPPKQSAEQISAAAT